MRRVSSSPYARLDAGRIAGNNVFAAQGLRPEFDGIESWSNLASARVAFAAVLVALAILCVSAVPGWVGIAIARRWAAAGGAVLVAGGLLHLVPVALFVRGPLRGSDWILVVIPVLSGLLCMAVGVLFLASWRISKAPESSHESAQERT